MRSSLSRYVFLVVLLFAWIVPYAVVAHTYPIPTFYSEFAALALYLFAGASIGCAIVVERAGGLATSPRVAIVPIAMALLLLLQTRVLPTEQPTMNLLGACFLLAALMAVHIGYWTSRLNLSDLALRVIAFALILGGLFAVFCQVVQLLNLEARFSPFVVVYRIAVDRRPFGNMAQANHLATYISFAMAAAVFLAQTRRLSMVLWTLFAAVYFVGEALTVSRTPWLQTAIVLVGAVAMALIERRPVGLRMLDGASREGKWRRWAVPVLLIVLFLVVNYAVRWANVVYSLHLADSAADRFLEAGQLSPRLALWHYGWTMFTSHPWLGVGWGEFPHYQYELVETLGRVEIANNSHDIVIDLLAKTGIVGAGIVFGGLLLWLIRAAKVSLSASRIFCFTLLGVFGVHALVEYPQQYMFFLLPVAFLIGLLDTRSTRLSPLSSHLGVGAIIVLGIAMLYPTLADYRRAEVLYYGAHPEEQYRAAPSRIFGAWGEYGLATLMPLSKQNLSKNLAMHRKAIALLPGETVIRRYAVLLVLAGRPDDALDQVRRLKIFAEALDDWPEQLSILYRTCDDEGAPLASFKAQLVALYGPATNADDTDEDSD